MRKVALIILCLTLMAGAQENAAGAQEKTAGAQEKIAWYGSREQGLRAALETRRPILLVAAAVQCRGVSGIY